jgi:hypothetical protein
LRTRRRLGPGVARPVVVGDRLAAQPTLERALLRLGARELGLGLRAFRFGLRALRLRLGELALERLDAAPSGVAVAAVGHPAECRL